MICKLEYLSGFREGDYSPVELAWCAYVSDEEYTRIIEKYTALEEEIKKK